MDGLIAIDGKEALRLSRELARREGIFVGITAGATFGGALQLAQQVPEGTNILCMLPDTGERYLSTPLFEDIPEEMTPDEIELSLSTPGNRFDLDTPSPVASSPAEADQEAADFVKDVLENKEQPVVMFAHQWCEFCWSVRKMFDRCGIEYRSVDLDSVAYQDNNWGGRIRSVLKVITDCSTIPQIFVGGQYIGGCKELFDEFKSGELQRMLEQNGVACNSTGQFDPYTLLPAWLQPR